MNDYVGKPIDEAELLAALWRCAERKASSSQANVRPQASSQAHPVLTPLTPEPSATPAAAPSEIPNQKPEVTSADDEPYFPARLIRLFLQETTKRLAELTEAFHRQDAEAVQRIAHTIKGTAGNFRAQQLYELAREIELAARQGRMHEVNGQIGQMREAFVAVEQKFSAFHEHAT
jgi:HPt (histidine-containing phosphotransfer) domain-containing protein